METPEILPNILRKVRFVCAAYRRNTNLELHLDSNDRDWPH